MSESAHPWMSICGGTAPVATGMAGMGLQRAGQRKARPLATVRAQRTL